MATRKTSKKIEDEEQAERSSGVWEKEDTPPEQDVRAQLAAFCRREEGLLDRWLLKRVPAQVAFDLRAAAFLAVAEHAGGGAMPAKPAGFLYGAAQNLVLEHHRQQEQLRERDGGDEVDVMPRSLRDAEQVLIGVEEQRFVQELLAQMDDEDAWWIRAVVLEELPLEEAVALREIGADAGRQRLRRARERFGELARRKVAEEEWRIMAGLRVGRRKRRGGSR